MSCLKFFIFSSNRIIKDGIQGYREARFRERKDLLLTQLYSLKTRHASGIQTFFLCPGNWSLFITVSASLIKDIASLYKPCLSDFKTH